jgi:L-lactate dehydrogenase complex protein LldF
MMTATLTEFKQSTTIALHDVQLQGALAGVSSGMFLNRNRALAEVPDVEQLRDHLKAVRSATLGQLAEHLQTFEAKAQAAGARVHWAQDGAEARAIVLEIAQKHGVKLVTKSKSMVTEEIHLNAALEEAGIVPIETDLGEYIIQLAQEPPSHIIAPAIHKTKYQVAALMSEVAGRPLSADDIPGMTAVARQLLREKFLTAGMGISGVNLGVAETGSVVLVTNEGNGRLVTSIPRVHVALMGIEKIAPTWDDAAAWLSLLARSATGQPLSIYTSIITGPRRHDDLDGPDEVHIILLDNNRSRQVGTKYEEVLQCLRCGACLNACPVYRKAGGHAYGSPYSGPIGAVVSPLIFGLEEYGALPHASTLCGACLDVCPVRIDLPRMLLELRADEVGQRMVPTLERWAEQTAAFVFGHEKLMRYGANVGRWIPLPVLNVNGRQLPQLAPRSFRQMWPELKEQDAS